MAKYVVRLTSEERETLTELITKGLKSAYVRLRARVLLKADADSKSESWSDEKICEAFETSLSTIHRVRQTFVEQGIEAALYRKKSLGRQYRKLDGEKEARLAALACSDPPKGRTRWTLNMLADKLVELNVVDSITSECVRTTLKKTSLNHGLKSNG